MSKREVSRRGHQEVMPSLAELAVTANEEHAACEVVLEAALRGALHHAIEAGEALIAARQQVPVGQWHRWLRENFDGSLAAATRYSRIAVYQHMVTEAHGVKHALELLSGLPDAQSRAGARRLYDDEKREAVLRDLQDGTLEDVAAAHGVSVSTVWKWANPHKEAAIRRRWRANRQRQRLALQELERERKAKVAVRKAGKALSEAYAMAERMQDVLAQAENETEGRSRIMLKQAGEHYRQMRDEIVSALLADD